MSPQVFINGRMVSFRGNYPEEAKGAKLYNSKCFYSAGEYGSVLIQYLNEYGFAVLYITAQVEDGVTAAINLQELFFFCCINLLQPVNVTPAGGRKFQCKRNSVLLAYSSLSGYTLEFEKGEYRSITVIYPVSFVKKQLLYFPSLEGLREKLKEEREVVLPNIVAPVFAAISNCVYEILHVPRMFFTEQHHQANMKGLLKEVCRHMSENPAPQPLTTLWDLECVKKAKEWLDMHLDKHITIADLAKKVGINEFKLKKSFKELYNIGVYGYFLQQRLLIAKKQLEETNLPIREIARRAGYSKAVNFSAAFKRVYGKTPIQHRQQSGTH